MPDEALTRAEQKAAWLAEYRTDARRPALKDEEVIVQYAQRSCTVDRVCVKLQSKAGRRAVIHEVIG